MVHTICVPFHMLANLEGNLQLENRKEAEAMHWGPYRHPLAGARKRNCVQVFVRLQSLLDENVYGVRAASLKDTTSRPSRSAPAEAEN